MLQLKTILALANTIRSNIDVKCFSKRIKSYKCCKVWIVKQILTVKVLVPNYLPLKEKKIKIVSKTISFNSQSLLIWHIVANTGYTVR